jgi:hypothetical protein
LIVRSIAAWISQPGSNVAELRLPGTTDNLPMVGLVLVRLSIRPSYNKNN